MSKNKFWFYLLLIVVIGLALRLLLAFRFYGTQDVDAWEQFSTYWQQGKPPYDATHRYNYAPPWFWIISFAEYLRHFVHIPFSTAIKFPLILADLLIFWIILKGSRLLGKSDQETLLCGSAFFLNPVSILLSGYHGQFDNISLFFSITAWYLYEKKSEWVSFVIATLSFSLAVAVKHFNILLTPVFMFFQKMWLRKILVVISAPALFLILITPYWIANTEWVNKAVFKYNLHAGYWGWSGVICRSTLFFTGVDLIRMPWFRWLDYFNHSLYLGILIASYFLVRKYSLLDSIILIFLIFFAFTTQIAPQYTLWIIPFAALRPHRYFWVYSAVGAVQIGLFFYCHYHWTHHLGFVGTIPNLASKVFVIFRYLTWAVCVAWLVCLLRRNKWVLKEAKGGF